MVWSDEVGEIGQGSLGQGVLQCGVISWGWRVSLAQPLDACGERGSRMGRPFKLEESDRGIHGGEARTTGLAFRWQEKAAALGEGGRFFLST